MRHALCFIYELSADAQASQLPNFLPSDLLSSHLPTLSPSIISSVPAFQPPSIPAFLYEANNQ